MKIVFMGTPVFAVSCLNALVSRHDVVAVCTQPDRPSGRGHKLQASPVKEAALAQGIPVLQPETLRLSDSNAQEIRTQLANFGADIFIVAAYGLLLPKGVLSMPTHGCVNVHASLLPKYRGASPIHSAILNGDDETGITIMQMDSGMDTGDIILQRTLGIAKTETFPELHDRMSELGAIALIEALEQIENNTATRTPQVHSQATHSPLIKKSDGEINWSNPTEKILNQIRALNCFTTYNGEILKIWGARKIDNDNSQGLTFKTADGAIQITELQAPGKKRMPAEDFLRGRGMH
jgi:methionyl-tRNA formyltransferase